MTTKTKRIMRKLRIDEVSGVKNPAQVSGKKTIVKDKDGNTIKSWDDTVDFVTSSSNGHVHGITVWYEDGKPKMRCNYASMDTVDGSYTNHTHDIYYNEESSQWELSENNGHSHTIDNEDIKTQLDGVFASFNISKKSKETKMTDEEKKEMDKLKTEKEAQDAKLARLESISKLSATQKAHFDTLKDVEKEDAFLAKSVEEKDAEIAEIEKEKKSEDKLLYKSDDGTEYRESDGAKLAKMAKEQDELVKENAKLIKQNEDSALLKETTEIFSHFKGEDDVKVSALRALKGIKDEAVRDTVTDMIKTANETIKQIYDVTGHGGETDPTVSESVLAKASDAEKELNKIAKSIETEEGLSKSQAYAEAMNRNPKLYEATIVG